MQIVCAILGGGGDSNLRDAFPVQMDQDATVAGLISKLNVALGALEAGNLSLYKVNLAITVETYATVIESITQRTIGLDESTELKFPFLKLSDMNGGIPDGHIHILVDRPAGESFADVTYPPITDLLSSTLTQLTGHPSLSLTPLTPLSSNICILPNDNAPRLTPYYHFLIDVNAIPPRLSLASLTNDIDRE